MNFVCRKLFFPFVYDQCTKFKPRELLLFFCCFFALFCLCKRLFLINGFSSIIRHSFTLLYEIRPFFFFITYKEKRNQNIAYECCIILRLRTDSIMSTKWLVYFSCDKIKMTRFNVDVLFKIINQLLILNIRVW